MKLKHPKRQKKTNHNAHVVVVAVHVSQKLPPTITQPNHRRLSKTMLKHSQKVRQSQRQLMKQKSLKRSLLVAAVSRRPKPKMRQPKSLQQSLRKLWLK